MVANRQLATQRNISQENIEAIDALHEMLEKLIDSYTLEIPYEEARDLVISANMTLSNLWGFTYDSVFDTWTPRLVMHIKTTALMKLQDGLTRYMKQIMVFVRQRVMKIL